jgi:hypothetical protein
MPSIRRLAFLTVLLATLAVVPAAHARVVLVATADGNATLTDADDQQGRCPRTHRRGARAVAIARRTRGYVATGRHVAAIDLATARSWPAAQRAGRDQGARRVGRRAAPVRVRAPRDRRHDAPTMTVIVDRARRQGERSAAGHLVGRHACRRRLRATASASSTSCASASRGG